MRMKFIEERLIKGWITSILGLVGILLIIVHVTGIYRFKESIIFNDCNNILLSLFICFVLFFTPYSKLEKYIEDIIFRKIKNYKNSSKNGKE